MIDHDAKSGPLTRCQICGSSHLRQIIDLGHQPPCDSLLTAEQLNEPEVTYPLRLNQCEECSLAQLDYVVPADKVYPADYPYKAGISWPVVAAHRAMAAGLVERFGKGLVVDVGCNDGTLLQEFKHLGCTVEGVEPTNIARVAMDKDLQVWQLPFTEALAGVIADDSDDAHIITFTNVFAHMADLGEVMRGVVALLAKDGVLVVENHYLLDVLERNQFDTIYHEHIRTYSLQSLVRLFEQYGLRVFDVDRVPRYGGNIRVYVDRCLRPVEKAVGNLLELEHAKGLNTAHAWAWFRGAVYDARDDFWSFKHSGSLVGCSAPGRASTLLNFYGVTKDVLPWTGELDGSLKIGKYIPGCHIPVVSNKQIVEAQADYVVLLAWHYAAEVTKRLRSEGVKSELVVPLPSLEIL